MRRGRGGAEPSKQTEINLPRVQWGKGSEEREGRGDYFRVARHENLKEMLVMEDVESWGRLSTLTPSRHLPHDKPTPSILKTFHTSRPRCKVDESPAASETAPKYEYIEDCKPLEQSCPSGFYPIKLSDHLYDGRYSIVQNLGFGGSSTVWLASDQKQQELVAIKIKTADSASESQEVDILNQLHGHLLIRQLLHSFIENSLNGSHHCLFMEAASCSLMQSKSLVFHGLLELPTARSIAADLVLTVHFLHGQGIVHGGE
ncbi:hypothetical protein AJ80_06269 [Polytolypa hystricis UAMH7299]|uniref:non-specific serine/threonine protein kinase n=1 Tax=Polytolypa hystricis (strain UAMH7299) TaxID=1447883 RepID=A0A2B7XYU0_POLH7|nr:hypothetical protein AJ80_06269 [Polytolypa hystricis UAMH7299]